MAKYVYFQEGGAPTAQDIEKSGILEGRLREGFVRIRQLLVCYLKTTHLPTERALQDAGADKRCDARRS